MRLVDRGFGRATTRPEPDKMPPVSGAVPTWRAQQVHFERSGAWRRWSVLAAIAVVAVAAVACLPPPPPPPPPPTTTTTQPPPSICGVTAAGAAATDAGAGADHGGADGNATEYVAVVRRNGRSKVLTRQAQTPAEVAQFRAEAEA